MCMVYLVYQFMKVMVMVLFEFMINSGKEISQLLSEALQNSFYVFLFLFPIFFIVFALIWLFKLFFKK